MKYIFSILAAATILVSSAQAQKNHPGFTVKGTLDSGIKTDSIFLYIGLINRVAAAPVVNGKFELKGKVSEPQTAEFAITTEGKLHGSGKMILENADYTYWRKGYNIKIKGGKLHDMVFGFESSDEYHAAVNDFLANEGRIYANKTYEQVTPDEKKLLEEKSSVAHNIEYRALDEVIKDPKAPVLAKVFALGRTENWNNYPSEKRVELFNEYEKQLGYPSLELINARAAYKEMIEQEKASQTVSSGKLYKEVVAKDTNGKEIKLSEVVSKNKFTILEFWASWCGPCRGEIPNLKKAYAKYKGKGLEIYSISIDQKPKDWLKALKEENTTWIQVLDREKAAKDYGVSGVPASFLIGQDGKIVASSDALRGSDLDKTLSRYIK